ncbi:MAG: hypothetical protein JSS32_09975 [Verrucomicrobia bacterium]|nr:hypothetical protein [Verrucomicrobiota bacterium]
MAAPIQRYSDPRLNGTILTKPFYDSYQWIRTVNHPMHPKCNRIEECAVRAMKAITGALALVLTALPALVGRAIQIIHYHRLSRVERLSPERIDVDGLTLPEKEACPLPGPEKFHGTSERNAMQILRWGFDPRKTAIGSKLGEAVYVSASDTVSADYGEDQLILSLDLRNGEVAYLPDRFKDQMGWDLNNKKVMESVRKLFYLNGYRAIKYDLAHYGTEEAWAVYDPSCVTIREVRPAPLAVPLRNRNQRTLVAVSH